MKTLGVALTTTYVLGLSAAYVAALAWLVLGNPPTAIEPAALGLRCAAIGGLGGCLYCLRAIYLNYAVKRQWSSEWYVWYAIRPLVSAGCGAVAFLFLKAGLLILESGTHPDASDLGFYAVALVAGLNVDKCIRKIEDIARSVWGIEPSRTSAESERGRGTPSLGE